MLLFSLSASKAFFFLVGWWLFFSPLQAQQLEEIALPPTLTPVAFLTGNFNPEHFPLFQPVPKEVLIAYKREHTLYLRKEALQAFLAMQRAARQQGIALKIISAFRSYEAQRNIWQRKDRRQKLLEKNPTNRIKNILKFSAPPGLSRHHWGTEVDLNSLKNAYFSSSKKGRRVHRWLEKNAARFQFFLVYTPNRSKGFETEFWHYSYYPLASKLRQAFELHVHPNTLSALPSFPDLSPLSLEEIFYEYLRSINPFMLKHAGQEGRPLLPEPTRR